MSFVVSFVVQYAHNTEMVQTWVRSPRGEAHYMTERYESLSRPIMYERVCRVCEIAFRLRGGTGRWQETGWWAPRTLILARGCPLSVPTAPREIGGEVAGSSNARPR